MYILGLGHYVPDSVLRNTDLERMVDTSDDWITSRTGIKERRLAGDGQGCSDLALKAAIGALDDAGLSPADITHILLATFTPDYCTPTSACLVQHKLGASNCMMAMDIGAGCSGFVYGLDTARGLATIYPQATMLVVGSEVCTARVNFQDRNTCVLFGDGAGAAVVTARKTEGPRVVDTLLRADGSLGHLLPVGLEGGSREPYKIGQAVSASYFIHMNGRELFRHAVRGMAEMAERILAANGLSAEDVDLLIPHQANMRIIEALAKKLSFPLDKVFVNVDKYGNTSAASVAIALSEAKACGQVKEGNMVLLVSFGAGLTWGTSLVQY
jgi:3-oxoacyl-[acyl-carrier-protein] synthase-3